MQIDYDKIYKFKTIALKRNQCHPDIKKDKKWALKFTIMHGLYTVVFSTIVYNIFYVDLKNDDISKLCKDGALAVVYFEVTFNYWVFLRGQHLLKYLIDTMKDDLKAANSLNADEQNIVLKNALHGAWINKIWFIIAFGGANLFILDNLIANIRSYIKGDFKLVPVFEFEYPEFIDADNLIIFIINYGLFTFFLVYSSMMYASFVALGPSFILHAYGQFELLIKEVDNLFVEDDRDLKDKIKSILLKQQKIYCFVDRINETFRVAYDLIMKSTVIATPISAYDVRYSLSEGYVSLEFLTVMIVSPMISSFVCYYSELLMQQSERFRQAIYCCGWERSYDRRVRTSITLILQRALRPAAIQTLFSTICLIALSETISKGEFSLDFLTFIFGWVLFSSSPCYYSELLMEKSNNFLTAIYSCGWERIYDRRTRSSIVLILERTSRLVAIHTMFRNLCLDALTDVFQQAYTLFNLMNAMWD